MEDEYRYLLKKVEKAKRARRGNFKEEKNFISKWERKYSQDQNFLNFIDYLWKIVFYTTK
jgi:hypothetical protein